MKKSFIIVLCVAVVATSVIVGMLAFRPGQKKPDASTSGAFADKRDAGQESNLEDQPVVNKIGVSLNDDEDPEPNTVVASPNNIEDSDVNKIGASSNNLQDSDVSKIEPSPNNLEDSDVNMIEPSPNNLEDSDVSKIETSPNDPQDSDVNNIEASPNDLEDSSVNKSSASPELDVTVIVGDNADSVVTGPSDTKPIPAELPTSHLPECNPDQDAALNEDPLQKNEDSFPEVTPDAECKPETSGSRLKSNAKIGALCIAARCRSEFSKQHLQDYYRLLEASSKGRPFAALTNDIFLSNATAAMKEAVDVFERDLKTGLESMAACFEGPCENDTIAADLSAWRSKYEWYLDEVRSSRFQKHLTSALDLDDCERRLDALDLFLQQE